MQEFQLIANGVNGTTGEYLLPPLTAHQLAEIASGQRLDPAEVEELMEWIDLYAPEDGMRGPKAGVDPKKLAEAGWGVVFAEGVSGAVREALRPLLAHRQVQAAEHHDYYRELSYLPGESKNGFLSRHQAGPGPADPEKLPYYLLLVGGPEEIPFRFQYQLDVQYAVGRIHFDTAEEYANYARSVVEAETQPPTLERRAAFFGVHNADDEATPVSAEYLIRPLAETLAGKRPDWQIETCLAEEATCSELGRFLGGEATPALLLTASHGMGFSKHDRRQRPHQGALLCQDWPGPRVWSGPISREHYFAAEDVTDSASLSGLIAFHFACYGAGTPHWDDFARQATGGRRALAEEAFLSRLPQRLLGHPRGGALAVVGHVDKAWGYSFLWEDNGEQLAAFESVLTLLCDGCPVGWAMEYFNQRYAELAVDLTEELERRDIGEEVDARALSQLWTAHKDARNYVVLGDPAVRSPAAQLP